MWLNCGIYITLCSLIICAMKTFIEIDVLIEYDKIHFLYDFNNNLMLH